MPRDIDVLAEEMHAALAELQANPPYILVAHSIGSLEALRFAQMHKDEVKGIVLIDGSNPEMYSVVKPPSTFARLRFSCTNFLIYAANKTGLSRLLFRFVPGFYMKTPLGAARNHLDKTPQGFPELDAAMFLKTFDNANQVAEGDNKVENCATVASHGYLGDIPLTILTSQQLRDSSESWENQQNLKKWSHNASHILVPGAGHAIHWTHPEVINEAIRRMLRRKDS